MGNKSQGRPLDAAIAAIAERQHGVIGHSQLLALGLSRKMIHLRVRAGRLHRIHQGVYAVGHRRLSQRGRYMAAVLSGGEDAVLSHRSAAALWDILPARGRIHVTTPRTLRERDGVRFHCGGLRTDETTEHDGIPTTTVARTLLDIAASEPGRFEQALGEAEYRRLDDPVGLTALVARHPTRRGVATVRAALASARAGATREELEHRFRALISKHKLPRPEFNAGLELAPGRWIKPDCIWRKARLIVELDSRAAHETASRFDSDRERDRLLMLAGWRVVRVTWRQVTGDARRLARDLRRLTQPA